MCEIAAAVAWFGVAIVLSVIVDRVFLGGATTGEVRGPVVLAGVLVFVRMGAIWLGDVAGQRAATTVVHDLRMALTAHLAALGPVATSGERTGELVRAAGEGADAVDRYLTRYRPARVLAMVVPVIAVGIIGVLDPVSLVVIGFTGGLLVLLLVLIGRRIGASAAARETELGWMSAHFMDVVRGIPELKRFGRSGEQAEVIEAIGRRYASSTMEVLRAVFQTSLVMEWGATAATALVAIEVSVRLMNNAIGFQSALAVLLLTPECFAPLRRLAGEYHSGPAGMTAAARIFQILDTPSPMVTGGALPVPDRIDIRLEGVRLTFGGGRRALDDCSLDLPAGARLALVGPTGSGKSSVAGLLMGFARPGEGRITVGGTDLGELDLDAWRRAIGYVPQHPVLVHGTIEENLRLSVPGASNEALWAALEAAGARGFVRAAADGLRTRVGEGGARLSGGERQRLALARAFLREPRLLILDEATSHLDDKAQAHVLATIRSWPRDRSVLLIAHRPEVAEAADMVAVLDAGRVVEVGSPASLAGRAGSKPAEPVRGDR